jgi:hypothetical protein
MRFNPGNYVKIKDTQKIKLISDSEVIDGVEIYYMSDKTSYSEFQIQISPPNEIVNYVINDNRDSIRNVFKSRTYEVAMKYKKRQDELRDLKRKEKERKKNLLEKIISFFFV